MNRKSESVLITQAVPLILTGIIFIGLAIFLRFFIIILNNFSDVDISLKIRLTDVLVGLTIYLKTSVDFAIYIGNLMHSYPGWKNRISIELGTAVGNALGTLIVLAIWNFFRDVEALLAIMIFIASLVLLRLAEDGFEHALAGNKLSGFLRQILMITEKILSKINSIYAPIFNKLIPSLNVKAQSKKIGFLARRPDVEKSGVFQKEFALFREEQAESRREQRPAQREPRPHASLRERVRADPNGRQHPIPDRLDSLRRDDGDVAGDGLLRRRPACKIRFRDEPDQRPRFQHVHGPHSHEPIRRGDPLHAERFPQRSGESPYTHRLPEKHHFPRRDYSLHAIRAVRLQAELVR